MKVKVFSNVNEYFIFILLFPVYLNVCGLHIQKRPENKTIREGSETKIHCNVDGLREGEFIRWYSYALQDYISKNWEILNTLNSDQMRRFSILRGVPGDRSYDLEITNSQSGDSGRYECVHEAVNGMVTSFSPRAEITLKVLSPKENGVRCDIEVVGGAAFTNGSTIRFICATTSYANSHTKLKLYHDDDRLHTYNEENVAGKLVKTSNKYTINKETNFMCRLRIDDKTLETCQLNLLPPGTVTLTPESINVQAGNTVDYTCNAKGFKNNRLEYSWDFNPRPPPGLYFTSNSTLTIPDVQTEYNGTVIMCTVSGGGTIINVTTILYVNESRDTVAQSIFISSTIVICIIIFSICMYFIVKRKSNRKPAFNIRQRTPSRRKLTTREYPTAGRDNITIKRNDTITSSVKIRHNIYKESQKEIFNPSDYNEVGMNDERDTVYENVDPSETIEDFTWNSATVEVEMKCTSVSDGIKYAELDLPYTGTVIHDTCYKVTYSEVQL